VGIAKTTARGQYEELPIQMIVKRPDLLTSAECEDVAEDILAIMQDPPVIYHITLWKRTDLELYQQIIFSGFSTIPSDTMRIIGITYKDSPTGGTTVAIDVTTDKDLSSMRLLKTLVQDQTRTTESIARHIVKQEVQEILIGTGTDTEGKVILEKDGRTIDVRYE
jgi:hypothetical protein